MSLARKRSALLIATLAALGALAACGPAMPTAGPTPGAPSTPAAASPAVPSPTAAATGPAATEPPGPGETPAAPEASATPVTGRPSLAEVALTVADIDRLRQGYYLPATIDLTAELADAPGALEVYARGLTPARARRVTRVALLRYASPAEAEQHSAAFRELYLASGLPLDPPLSQPPGSWLVDTPVPPGVTLGFTQGEVVALITYRLNEEFPGEDFAPWVMLLGKAQWQRLVDAGY
jgi:hypothetical protein